MMEMAAKLTMKPEDFRLIREFVAETFGLMLDDGKEAYLAAKLLPRIEALKLSSFAEYYSYLKFSPGSANEQLKFISLITNNETYFFREEAQLKAFAESILPLLKEHKLKKGERRIRIVSAGCSTGEEVYTLAMLLIEAGCFLWDWDVKITGVDVDPATISRAVAGIYSGRAFQATSPFYRERYFTPCDQGLQVREILRKVTGFMQGNLIGFDRMFPPGTIDIIFCRNVLIYFNDDTIRRIVDDFAKVLAGESFLFLGHSESLASITGQYLPMRFPGAIVYRLKANDGYLS